MKKRSLKNLLNKGYKIKYMQFETNYYEFRICVETEIGNTWFFYKSYPRFLKTKHFNESMLIGLPDGSKITKISLYLG